MLNGRLTTRTAAAAALLGATAAALAVCIAQATADSQGPNNTRATPTDDQLIAQISLTHRAADLPTPVERETLGARFTKSSISRDARSFRAPTGKGWVFTDEEMLCIAIPDPSVGYGVSCTPSDSAATFGAVVALLDPRAPGRSMIAAILPPGATSTVEASSGARQSLPRTSGVVTAVVQSARSVSVRGRDGDVRRLDLPDVSQIRVAADCETLPGNPRRPGSAIDCR